MGAIDNRKSVSMNLRIGMDLITPEANKNILLEAGNGTVPQTLAIRLLPRPGVLVIDESLLRSSPSK